jgi:hypothetical protein
VFENTLSGTRTTLIQKLRKKYGVKTKDERAAEKVPALEAFYRKHRRCPRLLAPEEKELFVFENGLAGRDPELLQRLRERNGVKTQHDISAEKLGALEGFYRKHRRCPRRTNLEEKALGRFEANLSHRQSDLLRKLRKKYGVKTRYD